MDWSVATETGLVLNPIIKQCLSNSGSRPTCTKDKLGCGLIPELCGADFALFKVKRTRGCLYQVFSDTGLEIKLDLSCFAGENRRKKAVNI